MFTHAIFAMLGATAVVFAGPSTTTGPSPSRTTAKTGVTHSVVAGLGGALVFDPDNIVAEIGDVVEWHFLPKNHSVAQSSFVQPCVLDTTIAQSFFSGFFPVDKGEANAVFKNFVQNKNPIWYYLRKP